MPWDPPYYSGLIRAERCVSGEVLACEKAGPMCLEHLPTDWAAVPSLGAHAASACPAVTPPSGSCALGPVPVASVVSLCRPPECLPICLYPWCHPHYHSNESAALLKENRSENPSRVETRFMIQSFLDS